MKTLDVEENDSLLGRAKARALALDWAAYTELRKRRIIFITVAIASVLGVVGLILGLVFGLSDRREAVPDALTCPPGFVRGEQDLVFFVIGDWGRGGNGNQQRAAKLMGELGACFKPSFVVSTGDNFYTNGLKSQDDPYFKQTFTDVYTAPSLQVPWYSILGNHDYGELSSSQLETCSAPSLSQCASSQCCYSTFWQTSITTDSRWRLKQGAWKETVLNGKVDLFFLDTTPLLSKYRTLQWANTAHGISSQDPVAQKQQIESLLSGSQAPWRLVFGHHPVHSFGAHCDSDGKSGDCADMKFLKPWLKQYKVPVYFCGHDHDLQFIKERPDEEGGEGEEGKEVDPVAYVVSGAGADVRSGEFRKAKVPGDIDFYGVDDQGFVAVALKGDALVMHYFVSASPLPTRTVVIKRPA